MNESEKPNERQLILYQTEAGTVRIEVLYQSDTFWLNQKKIAELFGVDLRTVSYHLGEIYASGELSQGAALQRIRRVQREGGRDVAREIEFYNLDAIISVGYRGNRLMSPASVSERRCQLALRRRLPAKIGHGKGQIR